MKGDFTRSTFKPEKHYAQVLKQQGRVDVDADWNEQLGIQTYRLDTETIDLVGPCAVPRDHAGFGIQAQAGTLVISAGRGYVDGILCENEQDALPVTAQPDLPGFVLPTGGGRFLAYLHVWLRHITALEDPSIREVALSGPDTCTRAKVVWQVSLLSLGEVPAGFNCSSTSEAWNALVAASTGRLAARAEPDIASSGPCVVPAKAGFRRLENQLYRVEIHDPSTTAGGATFKWSRDNGSIVSSWLGINGNDLAVSNIGRDSVLGFAAGQWVELIDDTHELLFQPGTLVRLVSAKRQTLTIDPTTATGTLDFTRFPANPRVRRWDSAGRIPVTTGSFIALEDGVQVEFSPGTLRNGDYWTIPARTATADVEWPRDSSNAPVPLLPRGIAHHFCRLAIVALNNGVWSVIEDCRQIFPPLTSGQKSPGIHITGVTALDRQNSASSLPNDANVPVNRIIGGIDVQCDGPVQPTTITRPTCYVTVEIPFGSNVLRPAAGTPAQIGAYQTVTLAAAVSAAGNVISWRPLPQAACMLQRLPALIPANDRGILARLIIEGNFIFGLNDPALYLDGDPFGIASGPSTIIRFPTGDGIAAGKFFTWFWLTPPAVAGGGPALSFVLTASVPPTVRGEGITELAAELALTGTGGTPTASGVNVPQVNLQVFIGANITNRRFDATTNLSDVILRIDDPRSLNTDELTATNRPALTGVGGEGLDFSNGCAANVFQGQIVGTNGVLFQGVPIDPPGPNRRVLRISNLRFDGSQLTGGTAPGQLMASVSATGGPMPINNPQQLVAFGASGLAGVDARSADNGRGGPFSFRTADLNPNLANQPNPQGAVVTFNIRFREGFASSFKTQAQERGFVDPVLPGIGEAANGTLLHAVINGVPGGVRVFVTTREVVAGTTPPSPGGPFRKARLVALNAAGGGIVPVPPTGTTNNGDPIAQVAFTGGSATVFWEWISDDPQSPVRSEDVSFGVVFIAAAGQTIQGSGNVQGGFSPVSTVHTSSLADPVPRFVDTALAIGANSFTITP